MVSKFWEFLKFAKVIEGNFFFGHCFEFIMSNYFHFFAIHAGDLIHSHLFKNQ